jgi:pimeloyl-ACP methyl ester carboxylesterase
MKRGYVDLDFGQVHYRTHGRGKPILLIHQSPSSSLEYQKLMGFLGEKYQAVAMDTPGYGLSDPLPVPPVLTIPRYAAVVRQFMRAVGIERAAIFGHHTGATISLEFATAFPEATAALCWSALPFYEPAVRAERLRDPRFKPLVIDPRGQFLAELWNKYDIDAPAAVPADRKDQVTSALLAGTSGRDAYQAVFSFEEQARLPLVKAPAFLAIGSQDLFFPRLEAIKARMPALKTAVIEGGDGLTTVTRARELADLVMAFLAGIGY